MRESRLHRRSRRSIAPIPKKEFKGPEMKKGEGVNENGSRIRLAGPNSLLEIYPMENHRQ